MERPKQEDLDECKKILTSMFSHKTSPSNPNAPLSTTRIPDNSYYQRWKYSDKLFEKVYTASGYSTPKTPATLIDVKKQGVYPLDNSSFFRKNSSDYFSFVEDSDFLNFSPPLSHKNSVIDMIEESPGRYEHDFSQLGVLGSGEFGTVFKCLNKLDGFYYAVKQVKITAKSIRNEALQEAYILASSSMIDDNCYIIRYYSVWVEGKYLYICMELCEGSLKKHIEKQPVTEVFLCKLVRNIAKGLKKLHENNIIHMDIKPENILINKYGRFKLADLGLGRITTNLTDEIPEGDCRYLASEVLDPVCEDNIPNLTKADIFSLGATVYELMRGSVLPKNGAEWQDIRNGRVEMPKNFSYNLRKSVQLMLSKNPDSRPDARALLEKHFLSEKKKEILRWKNYANWLEKKLEDKKTAPVVKKRKLSF